MTPDLAMQFVESITIFGLIASIGGGFFGAAIGANNAFGFTGIAIFVAFAIAYATGSDVGFTYLAFGPAFGPHVAFAGGVAASAYAAGKKKLMADTGAGRDINQPLAGLGHPDVLLVGAVFGVGGYLLQKGIAMIPWFGTHTDSVALTVFISGIIARICFSKTKPFAWVSKPEGTKRWLDWQEKPSQYLTLGAFSGLFGAGIALTLAHFAHHTADKGIADVIMANSQALPFALSAICIFIICFGIKVPVTHHMTIMAALAAVKFLPVVGYNFYVALVIGVVFGMIAALVAEFIAHLCYDGGDTHIDPPAGAIWPTTTIILGLSSVLG
ncbi:hypothetical protein HMPREF0580_0551 [Mobiluncus mulieris ATCC 35239]|uniref:DUF7973 domain-containing protein n=1 Tax=Mobiluncus mulieris ATCC 35239 TaxID=871571 RepID=E0QNT7_9ACTO|nr:hypothetical protein [Mobiluncus mulieris]EEJ52886.1 hypothetical protein HMPREF0577_2199 [Mobiluncus mulieris ATCC 35243]EFM46833.1 hypothetical protein HMPREF0580_0551 [Mobiluncus mulieris ATCC 35239]MCU9993593.1 hypothetical protein [Mobiluncus mulieris]MCV0013121.1 hypothetical protein [Mobiluncus mulieris]NMW80972.1 hypothetical protein [Mobiluncus mulieris]